MKKLLLLLAAAFALQTIQAQQKEGTITYERKINMWKRITDEEMRARIPEYRTSKHILYFSDSVSLYKLIPEDDAPDPFAGGGGGGRFVMRMGGADGGDLYKNFASATSIQANEMGGRNFLITDTIRKAPWKITGETKQILGLNCRKATRKVAAPVMVNRTMNFSRNQNTDTTIKTAAPREIEVVAWFAENMPAPVGPDVYGQLPGVIMGLDIDNGSMVYTATDVKKTVDIKDLKEPKKGKKVTQEEYRKMMMGLMQNQGGGMMRMGGPGM